MSGGQEWGELLYLALVEPIGLLLRTNDRERARQALYRARQTLGDPALTRLQLRVSPLADGDLVIVKAHEIGPTPEDLLT